MCGISGIFKYENSSEIDLVSNLVKMNQRLTHRGPDDKGTWLGNKNTIGLAQTRLSILDLSHSGHQPMIHSETNNVITFNGEIFNFQDINQLYLINESFFSKSDTETLLKLYAKDGLGMFNKLNGMFAFAIWDNIKEQLILARDRSGKKPLYFSEMGGQFVFASEIKSILELPWIKKELDEVAFYDFLTYNFVPTPKTMFKNIEKFQPGYYMVVSKNGIQKYEPYYNLKQREFNCKSEEELCEVISDKLASSVKYRMISDVPVGVFLSGGVDSSAILHYMRENASGEIKSFTIGFEGQPNFNELEYANLVSKKYDTNHFVQMISPNDIIDFIPTITSIYDEPQADTTSIPIYFISKLASEQGIKVVLNGDGPDELFSGYKNYLRYIRNESLFKRLSNTSPFIKTSAKNIIGLFGKSSPYYEIASRIEHNQEQFWAGAGSIKESNKRDYLTEDFKTRIGTHNSYEYVEKLLDDYKNFCHNPINQDYTNWLCYSGFKSAVMEKYLFRSDRLGMAHSIESRSPFLDYEFIEFALSIPGEYKIKNNIPKYILKKSLEDKLPNEILYRKKMGFCLPIKEWANETIYEYILDNVENFCQETGLLDAKIVLKNLKQLKDGNDEQTNTMWTIYFVINWYNKWFKS